MSLKFLGKTAIVTGAGGAIGKSYALELAKRGCNVIVNDVGSSLSGTASTTTLDPAGKICICNHESYIIIISMVLHTPCRQSCQGNS